MKHRILLGLAAIASLLASSCVHLGDLELEPVPDISFEYVCDGLSYTFTSNVPGTSNVSWNVLGQGTGNGDSFKFTFPKPGSYWVSMTGTYNGQEQTVSTKLLVAKPSVVKLDDNTVSDWDKVNYPDFYFYGNNGLGYVKFDYDANYLYFLYVLKEGPGYGFDQAILNIRLDADDNAATGYSTKGLGVEWYYEGTLWSHDPWNCMYTPADLENGTEPADMPIKLGFRGVVDGYTMFEFGLSRKDYGVNTTTCALFTQFYTEGWDGAESFKDKDGNTSIHLSLDKSE